MRRRSLLCSAPLAALLAAVRASAEGPATIGIMGGAIDGTYMRVATDLTSVVNDDRIRVVPFVGKGSVQNLSDLLHLKGVDIALIQADVLSYAQRNNLHPGELSKIAYISKLYDEDVHVCARPEINSINELDGKPVNIDVEGSGTNLTARAVFQALGIKPDFRTEEPTIGQTRLQRGEIAANVYVAGRPVRLFANAPAGTGLHFLEVPINAELEQTYLPGGQLTSADYPNLVPAGEAVNTIGVGVTMAVFNWAPNTDRYRNLVAFVDAFFSRFPELLKPPHHPAWHQVNLAAAQPGWVRFKPAADWLAQRQKNATVASTTGPDRAQFEAFLAKHGGTRLTAAERDATWQYFQEQLHNQAHAKQ